MVGKVFLKILADGDRNLKPPSGIVQTDWMGFQNMHWIVQFQKHITLKSLSLEKFCFQKNCDSQKNKTTATV